MPAPTALRFLIAARQCEIGELEQLTRTSALVRQLGLLIHALQSERGLSNLVLASAGAHGVARRQRQVGECALCEADVRMAFDRLDMAAAPLGNGARLFSRIAYVLQGLDALPALRARIDTHGIGVAAATAAYVKLVAGLLAVVFEAADSATDPEVSRLLVALFNFMQGKEFAGQERATGAAAFGAGVSEPARQQHWLHLIEQQERCFQVFSEFAHSTPLALWRGTCDSGDMLAELERMRRIACTAAAGTPLDANLGTEWFDCCTRRMDAMQTVQARLAEDLLAECSRKIAAAHIALRTYQALLEHGAPPAPEPGFFDTPPGDAMEPASYGPHLDRSIHELVQEQAQRLQAMRDELDTVRASLNERKLVERAKGLLMAHRQLSESEAHKTLRETAMSQNRKMVEVAEAVLAMADLLPSRTSL